LLWNNSKRLRWGEKREANDVEKEKEVKEEGKRENEGRQLYLTIYRKIYATTIIISTTTTTTTTIPTPQLLQHN
tara:strand:- start:331 stop:552 length:222 start_codon:yes stop_codon:yes gene_type:complete